MAFENKIPRIFLSIGQIWIKNRGLNPAKNTENSAKTHDLSAKKAKNTPQAQNRSKTQKNVKKWHFIAFS